VPILAALFAAGAIYTYPELAIVILAAATAMAIEQAWTRKAAGTDGAHAARRFARGATVTAIVTGALVFPYWSDLQTFFLTQLSSGLSGGTRPGEGMFPGLLDRRYFLSAWMGLGGEQQISRFLTLTTVVAAVLLLLAAIGGWALVLRRRAALPAILATLWIAAAWLLWRDHYAYGGYKMLALAWWLTAFAIVYGIGWVMDRARHAWPSVPMRRVLLAAAWTVMLIVPVMTCRRVMAATAYAAPDSIDRFRIVQDAPRAAAGATVALISADPLRTAWGTYFLRRAPMFLAIRNGYLGQPHVAPLLDRAAPSGPEHIHFVITDADRSGGVDPTGWALLWQGGSFNLWDTGDRGWAALAPRGDAKSMTMMIVASRAGRATLFADAARESWAIDVKAGTNVVPLGAVPQALALHPEHLKVTLDSKMDSKADSTLDRER
jgi:hypothetical protein